MTFDNVALMLHGAFQLAKKQLTAFRLVSANKSSLFYRSYLCDLTTDSRSMQIAFDSCTSQTFRTISHST